jgi:hypothetical protein
MISTWLGSDNFIVSDGLLCHFKCLQDVVCRVIHGENKIIDRKSAHSWRGQHLPRHTMFEENPFLMENREDSM